MIWGIPILAGVAMGAVTVLVNRLALRHWDRWQVEHWSERARRFQSVRVTATFNPFFAAANAAMLGYWQAKASPPGLALLGGVGFVAALAGNYTVDRKLMRQPDGLGYFGGALRNWGLILSLAGLFGGAAWFIRGVDRPLGLGFALVAFLAVYLPLITLGWTPLLVRIGLIRPAPADLERRVRQEAESSGVPLRSVGLLDSYLALAFAQPFRKEVLLTPELVRILSEAELKSVIQHELAHLGEPRSVLAGRLLGSCAWVPLIFLGAAVRKFPGFGALVVMLSVGAISLAANRLARRMEIRADRASVESAEQGQIHARALEKIYAANLIPASGIARGRPHPDLYDRMVSAGITPDFPRPKAPHAVSASILIWIGLTLLQAVPVTMEWMRR